MRQMKQTGKRITAFLAALCISVIHVANYGSVLMHTQVIRHPPICDGSLLMTIMVVLYWQILMNQKKWWWKRRVFSKAVRRL